MASTESSEKIRRKLRKKKYCFLTLGKHYSYEYLPYE